LFFFFFFFFFFCSVRVHKKKKKNKPNTDHFSKFNIFFPPQANLTNGLGHGWGFGLAAPTKELF
jgi:hypothetical protein